MVLVALIACGRVRRRRATPTTPTRHARRDRRHRAAPAPRRGRQRCRHRRDRCRRRCGDRLSAGSWLHHGWNRPSATGSTHGTSRGGWLRRRGRRRGHLDAAAWWPARSVARVPIIEALSGRPPRRNRRAARRRWLGLVAVGLLSLLVADRNNALLVVSARSPPSPGCSRSARSRSERSPRWPGRSRSPSGSPCATCRATAPAPGSRWPPSASRSVYPWRSWSSPARPTPAPRLGNLAPDQLLVWTRDDSQPDGVSPFYTEDPDDDGFAPYLPDLTAVRTVRDADRSRRRCREPRRNGDPPRGRHRSRSASRSRRPSSCHPRPTNRHRLPRRRPPLRRHTRAARPLRPRPRRHRSRSRHRHHGTEWTDRHRHQHDRALVVEHIRYARTRSQRRTDQRVVHLTSRVVHHIRCASTARLDHHDDWLAAPLRHSVQRRPDRRVP